MRTPSRALPACPNGLLDGLGRPFAIVFFAAGFSAFNFTTFFDAALALGFVFALAFTFFAIVVSFRSSIDGTDLFLAKHALRVEVADTPALAAGRRVDHRVDECRLAGVHRLVHGALQLVGRRHIDADASECFCDLVVARILHEDGGRDIRAAARIDVGPAIDPVVVEDDDADREVVAADCLDLHARETEGAIAFDREHGFAGLDRRSDGKAHPDAHDAPCADIQALARLVHINNTAREIERVGALVYEDRIRTLLDDGAQR